MPPKLKLVPKTEPSEKEKVRIRIRKRTPKIMPVCRVCAGTTTMTIDTNGTKQKVCFFCAMKGEMVIVC